MCKWRNIGMIMLILSRAIGGMRDGNNNFFGFLMDSEHGFTLKCLRKAVLKCNIFYVEVLPGILVALVVDNLDFIREYHCHYIWNNAQEKTHKDND